MRPVIFVRLAHMNYYKGNKGDIPTYGGEYPRLHQDCAEKYNFCPYGSVVDGEEVCLGFAQINGYNNGNTQLHIEHIVGCELFKKEDHIDGVTVVFFAKATGLNQRVVGFYKNATVYRNYQCAQLSNGKCQAYLFKAKAKDCVLLPFEERQRKKENGYNVWWVREVKPKNKQYIPLDAIGTGESMFWFAAGKHVKAVPKEVEECEKIFVENILKEIDDYKGENWLYKGINDEWKGIYVNNLFIDDWYFC